MRNLKIILIILCITLFFAKTLNSKIIIRQDKDGKVVITNENTTFVSKHNKRSKAYSSNYVPSYIYSRIKHFAKKYGVKEKLILAIARAESGYNRFAKSNKGAIGIMQLMPETASQYGVYNLYNVDENISAGIKHLRYLYNRYNKNIVLTLAAYNAGETAVEKYSGVPPYRETRNYIKRIFRFMNKPLSGYNFASSSSKSKLYKYRTKEGRVVITDRYPSKIKKSQISIIKNY
jgi:soluble lytic murein transglycosylase-like protein